jgi:hypothetical protein
LDEISAIVAKYDENYIASLISAKDVSEFAAIFYRDVAEIYDALTRITNKERNPSGFSLDDAPILGLLVRSWKLLKEINRQYELKNGEIVLVLDRPFLEAAVTATYLVRGDATLMEDYRKCSYKHRLRNLADFKAGSKFFETKAGLRLLESIQEKMSFEKLSEGDFESQKKNRWRIQGLSFFDIFASVHDKSLYASTYGIMSESIHGSWNDSLELDLIKKNDGTFSANPFHTQPDVRFVSPLLIFSQLAFREWLQRIDVYDDAHRGLLDWIDRVNVVLFTRFDEEFDGP